MNGADSDSSKRWLIDAACRDTLNRVSHLADRRDFEAMAALFCEDAELTRPSGERLLGRAAIVAAYRAGPPQRLTRHLLCGTVLDVVSERQVSACTQVLLFAGSTADEASVQGRPAHGPALVGEFEDVLVLQADGHWRIARRTARFVLRAVDPT